MGLAVLVAPTSRAHTSSQDQGLPSATHQLGHLLPRCSQMSPCSDLHCPCTGCEGFTLLCSLLRHKGM